LGVKPAYGLCCIARLFDVGVAVSKDLARKLVPGDVKRMAEILAGEKISSEEALAR
jgi:hypothetical protein